MYVEWKQTRRFFFKCNNYIKLFAYGLGQNRKYESWYKKRKKERFIGCIDFKGFTEIQRKDEIEILKNNQNLPRNDFNQEPKKIQDEKYL